MLLPKQLTESEAIEQSIVIDKSCRRATTNEHRTFWHKVQQRQRKPVRMTRVPLAGSAWSMTLPERSSATQLEVSAASEQQSRIYIQLDNQSPMVCELSTQRIA